MTEPSESLPASVLAAYTTGQPWPAATPLPSGVFRFDEMEAAALGQSHPFVLDVRRLAYVPIGPAWFPRMNTPDGGVQGRASKPLQRRFWRAAEDLLTRHAELVERLGPLWPGSQR